jgi:predicted nuclease of predicted toxin-antitoxin system
MTAEVGLRGASDPEHIAWALSQGRVVFTQDDDFLRLHAADTPHAGIVYCHQQSLSLGAILRGLVLVWEVYEPEDMHNRVEYL